MIVGTGVDLVSISRVSKAWSRHPQRLAQKILADEELDAFAQASHKDYFLAKRFAIKEAAAKALGTGFRNGITLPSIMIKHNELGRPELKFTAKAKVQIESLGVKRSHVSVSDDSDYAVAMVILES